MTLAMDAEISQRHLSSIESGRAKPSRETVLAITEALDMPLRARNELLDAAGFSAFYPERPLEGAEMDRARETLRRILAHHEPHPAMVLHRSWNILMKNDASKRIVSHFLDEPAIAQLSPDGRPNFMRMMFHLLVGSWKLYLAFATDRGRVTGDSCPIRIAYSTA